MQLILISYLNHAYENILPEFEPSGSIILVPRIPQNVKTPDFDLRPDLDHACDLNIKFTCASGSSCGELSNAALHDSLRPTVREIAGGVINPQALKGTPVAQAVTG